MANTELISNLADALTKCSYHNILKFVREIEQGKDLDYPTIHVGVIRNHTLDNWPILLKGLGFLQGLRVDCVMEGYDHLLEALLEPSSAVNTKPCDILVVSLCLESFISKDENMSVDEITERLQQIAAAVGGNKYPIVIFNTFLQPVDNLLGAYSNKLPDSLENKVKVLNQWLQQLCQKHVNFYLIDWNQIEQRIGYHHSRDFRMWYMAKSLLTNLFLKEYAWEVIKLAKAQKGFNKKCLVLDCDNTLWGGIVGEDGLNGIQLSRNDYPGSIYYDVQKMITYWQQQGILVALCSKNNEADVFDILQHHPDNLIKREHLSAWRVNWEDKAGNLRSLAKELNIGLDSFVFVDDSPTECAWVMETLPMVTVWQVPKDLVNYPQEMRAQGWFDVLTISKEDKHRTTMYQEETVRQNMQKSFADINDFLKSLNLTVYVGLAQEDQITRVAQLTQKTNQFNLTSRRYSEGQIRGMQSKGDDVFILKVKDRFGDFGLTGVAIVRYEAKIATVDTFLLSCRVLGRKIEDVFLEHCIHHVQAQGVEIAIGEYIPTAKNNQTAQFYSRHGFELTEQKPDGVCSYSLKLSSWQPRTFSNIEVIIDQEQYNV